MSEYQYYDFRAIDRPLSSAQRAALREISTRAEISSTRFTNFYTFGDFKGNPVSLVERYFDAFLSLANWGTRELMFRVPVGRAPATRIFRSYLSTRLQTSAWFRVRGSHVILGFLSDDEEGGYLVPGFDRPPTAKSRRRAEVRAQEGHKMDAAPELREDHQEKVEAPGVELSIRSSESYWHYADLRPLLRGVRGFDSSGSLHSLRS